MSTANGQRFEALLRPHRAALQAYLHRLIGPPDQAEDVLQQSLLKAFESFESLRDEARFKSWLFSIATRTGIDHLRRHKRWRPFAQRLLEDHCHANEPDRLAVEASTRAEAYAFDVREHISFCFTCVGRSLDPLEAAAVLLREVLQLTNREAAHVLGVSESVFRHHLSHARAHMRETFEGLCSLVGKQGICWQCASFRRVAPEPKKGPSLPVIGEDLDQRLAIVREHHFLEGLSQSLHVHLLHALERLERQA